MHLSRAAPKTDQVRRRSWFLRLAKFLSPISVPATPSREYHSQWVRWIQAADPGTGLSEHACCGSTLRQDCILSLWQTMPWWCRLATVRRTERTSLSPSVVEQCRIYQWGHLTAVVQFKYTLVYLDLGANNTGNNEPMRTGTEARFAPAPTRVPISFPVLQIFSSPSWTRQSGL